MTSIIVRCKICGRECYLLGDGRPYCSRCRGRMIERRKKREKITKVKRKPVDFPPFKKK